MAKRKAKKATKKKASGRKAIIIVSGKKARPGSSRNAESSTAASQAKSQTEKEKERPVTEAAR